ncbi:MAG: SPOR domain-containing protein [Thermodesulfobacteriota bacterium]
MRLRTIHRTKPRPLILKPRRSAARRKTSSGNRRLVLAIAGSVALMLALVWLNVRFISDPPRPSKELRTATPSMNTGIPAAGPSRGPRADGARAACPTPPQVTFYRKLTAPEEAAPRSAVPAEEDLADGNLSDAAPGPIHGKTPTQRRGPAAAEGWGTPAAANRPSPFPDVKIESPRGPTGTKRYTVQVGTFSQPKVAQQWAREWKAKGYQVTLKPVARPASGIIYRLYLGDFASPDQAEELVNHLRDKEGIKAFALSVK